jgi:hypothetical protein
MRTELRFITGIAAASAAALSMSACGSPERGEVSDVAVRFVRAVGTGHGAAACALLTSTARSSVSGATDISCATAVLNVHEQKGDEATLTARGVQVWGDTAQVRVGGDVIFLRRQKAGWQVRAAGCTREPGTSYQCDVDG